MRRRELQHINMDKNKKLTAFFSVSVHVEKVIPSSTVNNSPQFIAISFSNPSCPVDSPLPFPALRYFLAAALQQKKKKKNALVKRTPHPFFLFKLKISWLSRVERPCIERERGLLLINISQAGQILKMKCLHIASAAPPKHSAGHFDYCRKAVVPPPISPTQSFAFFSLLALFHIFQFILSHLLFTCFFFSPPLVYPPTVFSFPLSSPQLI